MFIYFLISYPLLSCFYYFCFPELPNTSNPSFLVTTLSQILQFLFSVQNSSCTACWYSSHSCLPSTFHLYLPSCITFSALDCPITHQILILTPLLLHPLLSSCAHSPLLILGCSLYTTNLFSPHPQVHLPIHSDSSFPTLRSHAQTTFSSFCPFLFGDCSSPSPMCALKSPINTILKFLLLQSQNFWWG